MNQEQFNKYWKNEYPESYPINHELKYIYSDRWLRIHSLPESKRYAESDFEYNIILNRQNQLINDLIGEGTEFFISIGLYTGDTNNNNYTELTGYGDFYKTQTIDLSKARPLEYDEETYFEIYIKKEFWKSESKNNILKAIANDEIRAMFICPSKKCIVAPYDGGVDIIVDTTEKRNELKEKYRNWISQQEEGL